MRLFTWLLKSEPIREIDLLKSESIREIDRRLNEYIQEVEALEIHPNQSDIDPKSNLIRESKTQN